VELKDINIEETLKEAKALLDQEKNLSPAIKATMNVLILVVHLFANRVGLNSRNSSKPPSTDPNRPKEPPKNSDAKPGGQKGHTGSTLEKVGKPDETLVINIDRKTLPAGHYTEDGFETRQVFDIHICRKVTEYQAQVLVNDKGERFVAPFPKGVSKAVQYGPQVKAHAVYMSQYQLIPYARIQEYFTEQLEIPISKGSIFNFNKVACGLLDSFSEITKEQLIDAYRMNVDETGINIDGKRKWLHCASNDLWTDFFPHEKRGCEAMDSRGIIPEFSGVMCHDHWKPYYNYKQASHSLCNAHHSRELTRAHEQDGQLWAKKMDELLKEINKAVHEADGAIDDISASGYRQQYTELLEKAEIECPPPKEEEKEAGKRGRQKRSKSRNLLERLINYEDDVLRFMSDPEVPFTNNRGENDIRMTKVQQKISGCFRSWEGAEIFCRVRGYLSTCQKHGVSSSEAMALLFAGKLPDFAIKQPEAS
jgi:transposase